MISAELRLHDPRLLHPDEPFELTLDLLADAERECPPVLVELLG